MSDIKQTDNINISVLGGIDLFYQFHTIVADIAVFFYASYIPDEAEKLKRILEEEKSEAEREGDVVAAIVIGLLLAALAYLLYKLMSEEE
ncbi:MAG: hypothetical protein ACPL1Y_00020 [Thermoplasmata archaeon]